MSWYFEDERQTHARKMLDHEHFKKNRAINEFSAAINEVFSSFSKYTFMTSNSWKYVIKIFVSEMILSNFTMKNLVPTVQIDMTIWIDELTQWQIFHIVKVVWKRSKPKVPFVGIKFKTGSTLMKSFCQLFEKKYISFSVPLFSFWFILLGLINFFFRKWIHWLMIHCMIESFVVKQKLFHHQRV